MHDHKTSFRSTMSTVPLAAGWLIAAGGTAAYAHHPMGGMMPTTFMHGLLSGFGHPIVGIDHFAFIVAMGVAVGASRLNLAWPAAFVASSSLGVGLHVAGLNLPSVEIAVAVSVLLIGALVALGRAIPVPAWAALFGVAGLFHGYAFGETVAGAEPTPIAAYLVGLAIVQAALAVGAALAVRQIAAAPVPRIAGAAVALVGVAVLAGHLMAA